MQVYVNQWSPYCHKLLFFLQEAALAYELIDVDFQTFDFSAPAFLAVSPAGQIPAVVTEYGAVSESTVCMRYLSDRYAVERLYPRNLEDRASVDFWTEYVNQHIGRYLVSLSWHRFWMPKRGQEVDLKSVADSLTALNKYLPALNSHLLGRRFLHGAGVTIADINLMAYVNQSVTGEFSWENWPEMERWYRDMTDLPSWLRTIKKFKTPTLSASLSQRML